MKSYDVKLLLLFLAVAGAILIRISFKDHGFVSSDSVFYLQVAQNLLSGKGLIMTIPATEAAPARDIPYTIWPAGYPLLIAGVSFLSGLSVFWASKVVNLLALAGCLLLLRKFWPEKAWLLGLIFCSYTNLQVFSYSWSEGPFLFFLLLFCFGLKNLMVSKKPTWLLVLFLASAWLFLCRYIGLFAVPVMGLAAVYLWVKDEKKLAILLLVTALVAGLLVVAYLYRNFQITGSFSGWKRGFVNGQETATEFLQFLAIGLLNALLFWVQYFRKIGAGPVFWVLVFLQTCWVGYLYVQFFRIRRKVAINWLSMPAILALTALAYFLVLVYLRLRFPFDTFDYRMMAPFTLPGYTALIWLLLKKVPPQKSSLFELHLTLFFAFSLVLNTGYVVYSSLVV